jgi:hypothetical protein
LCLPSFLIGQIPLAFILGSHIWGTHEGCPYDCMAQVWLEPLRVQLLTKISIVLPSGWIGSDVFRYFHEGVFAADDMIMKITVP